MRKLSIENLNYISQLWIKGSSYFQILESCTEKSISIEKRGKSKPIDMSDIISICDNGLGYETSMVLNAINNILEELVGGIGSIDYVNKEAEIWATSGKRNQYL